VQSREDFLSCDLIPFKDAITSEVASIMAAHLAVSSTDSTSVPATISSKIVEELLIHDLGFKGLILTDSFFMGAITELGDEKDIAPLSILSGCDIILDPKEPVGVIERLNAMVGKGRLSQSLLDRSVKKLVKTKEKWLYASSCEKSFDEEYEKKLVAEIAQRSVCLLKGGKLSSNKATVYVLDVTEEKTDISTSFIEPLTNTGISCEKYNVAPHDARQCMSGSESNKGAVICLVYTSVAAWKGHTNLPVNFKQFLRGVSESNREKVLISFGSPYSVRGFEKFDTILCAFDSMDVCQHAVADVLLGKLEAQGQLPVKL
ncbi:MAG: glycoside hydrolase family 3 N-terminal domain-containing protein, partial [Thermodesulfobacteriota bacterium]